MKIKAKMTQEGETERRWVSRIPVVTESDHPRFVVGTRFDWGLVQAALDDGYTVEIEPDGINGSNCNHDKGFERSGGMTLSEWVYICPICKEFRYALKRNYDLAFILPVDFEGFRKGPL